MTHYAQHRSETSQDYLNWRDWTRALDVLEAVPAPSGGGIYRGRMLAGVIHAHRGTVFVDKFEVLRSKLSGIQRIVGAFVTGETVRIPAAALSEPAWLANLRDPLLSKDTESVGVTVRSILDSVNPNTRAEIGKLLASVDVSRSAPSHLLAVLSSLFTWREVMPEWEILRDRAYQHYSEKRLKGVERAFKGLM